MQHTYTRNIAIVLFAAAAVTNAVQSCAAQVRQYNNPVPVIGKTADGKYHVYDLDGELSDVNYHSSKSIMYQPDDLPDRMDFISPKDVNKGVYECDFICKDKAGHVVGLNPQWAKVYGKPVPK